MVYGKSSQPQTRLRWIQNPCTRRKLPIQAVAETVTAVGSVESALSGFRQLRPPRNGAVLRVVFQTQSYELFEYRHCIYQLKMPQSTSLDYATSELIRRERQGARYIPTERWAVSVVSSIQRTRMTALQLANHIEVIGAGQLVESGSAERILHRSAQSYTHELLVAVPEVPRPQPSVIFSPQSLRSYPRDVPAILW